METIPKCILRCVRNSHDPIILPHKQCILIGRGPETKITDKKCSRNQVSLCADVDMMEVKVKQMGPNITGVNGMALKMHETHTLKHEDRLEILLGNYIHVIEFDPPPVMQRNLDNGNKRKLDDENKFNKRKCEVVTESKDYLNADRVQNSGHNWETIDNGKLLIYTAENVIAQSKIAAYDLDGTIITTQSGRVFPKDINDWKISLTEVPGKLKQLHSDGYKIVFMTNQAGIGKGNVSHADFKSKVVKIVNKLGVPVQVFISTGKGIYRKPAPGMWNALKEKKNNGVHIDMSDSFYCGDAAGREANWAPKKKKDFSSADRLMALNLGIKFYTPEEHFLNHRVAPFKLPDFNPSTLNNNIPLCEPPDTKLKSNDKEVVILVGSPGSGKSSFVTNHLISQGYHHVNRDTLGSWQKCVIALESALSAGKSVVIDNTNPDRESRHRFISAARKQGATCRCFVMKTSMEHAKHNNKFREFTDDSHEPISEMIINMYKNKYVEPSVEEGFTAVVKVNFIPKFNDPELEQLYKMYLLEK